MVAEEIALVEHLCGGRRFANRMRIAIQNLPSIYRQVLVMRDVEEMTAAEVAATLEITVEAVKSRLHRARNMLRTTLTISAPKQQY